jgi:hypothetical protein
MAQITARERQLIMDAMAGTAYMMFDIFKTFPNNHEARREAMMMGMHHITGVFLPDDPQATNEILNRVAEACKQPTPKASKPGMSPGGIALP